MELSLILASCIVHDIGRHDTCAFKSIQTKLDLHDDYDDIKEVQNLTYSIMKLRSPGLLDVQSFEHYKDNCLIIVNHIPILSQNEGDNWICGYFICSFILLDRDN